MKDLNLKRFLDEEGKLLVWPKKQTDKELVTAYLATKFQSDKSYTEREVNEVLKVWHVFGDWAILRRELFERGYLDRDRSGTDYRRLK
jgi:hypothetical protein